MMRGADRQGMKVRFRSQLWQVQALRPRRPRQLGIVARGCEGPGTRAALWLVLHAPAVRATRSRAFDFERPRYVILTRTAPLQDLAVFQSEVTDSYTTTNQAYTSMTADKLQVRESNLVYARAPPVSSADYYLPASVPKTAPSARRWQSVSRATYGDASAGERMVRAETALDEAFDKSRPNTQALEEPYYTEPPVMDVPATAFYHGPMPDRAINQHFLHRRTTASVIDGPARPAPAPGAARGGVRGG